MCIEISTPRPLRVLTLQYIYICVYAYTHMMVYTYVGIRV